MKLQSETGAVTAEFVIVLPAAVVVFGVLAGAMQLQLQQARLFQAAAVAARQVAWGSGSPEPVPGVTFTLDTTESRSCVEAKPSVANAWLVDLSRGERQCLPNLGY